MTPEFLQWDSDHFGVRIARTHAPRNTPDWRAVDDWAFNNQINCLYVFATNKDSAAIKLAEEHAARCMDERIILEAIGSNASAVSGLRMAEQADLAELEAIAASSFIDSRFFRDPNFPRERCEGLFRTWIRKSVHGYARAVLVAGEIGAPTGFVTCRDEKIDLLAVAGSSRGRGIGALLTNGATHWFASQCVRRVSVLARSSNDSAIRLYKRCGFVPASTEFVFHKWYTRP
ncbi:MAG: GNAT family N-acetyltransferase [Anaerolineae bacterium]|nr:GNAT family N-acetyltransferase [Phycisphaerae bacterium]